MKMRFPLPNGNARCIGSNCEKKQDCSRYLSIEVDTKDYFWHMDAKRELKEQDCTLFIDFRNGNYYEN
jgi:hypothetical protein